MKRVLRSLSVCFFSVSLVTFPIVREENKKLVMLARDPRHGPLSPSPPFLSGKRAAAWHGAERGQERSASSPHAMWCAEISCSKRLIGKTPMKKCAKWECQTRQRGEGGVHRGESEKQNRWVKSESTGYRVVALSRFHFAWFSQTLFSFKLWQSSLSLDVFPKPRAISWFSFISLVHSLAFLFLFFRGFLGSGRSYFRMSWPP